MSQVIKVYPGGFELNATVPASVDEYNALAPSRANAVLEDAVSNTMYRSVFAEFRAKFASKLEELTGIKRNTKTVKKDGKDVEVIDESEGKYLARVEAASGLEEADFLAKYQPDAQSILDGIKFDPSTKERSSDGPKVGKNDIKVATELLAKGGNEATRVAGLLGAKLNREVALGDDAEANKSILARAFGDYRRQKAAEQAAETKAEFAI